MIANIEAILSLLLPAAVVAGAKHTAGETTTTLDNLQVAFNGKATLITATSPSARKLTTKVTGKLPASFARRPVRKRSTPAITQLSSACSVQSPRQR